VQGDALLPEGGNGRWASRSAHRRSHPPAYSIGVRTLRVEYGPAATILGQGDPATSVAVAATLDAESAPEAAARRLLAQANDGAASDNIILLVVRFDATDSNTQEGRDTR